MSPIVHLKPGCFSYLLLPAALRPGLLRLSALGFTPNIFSSLATTVTFLETTQCASFWACPLLLAPLMLTFPEYCCSLGPLLLPLFTVQALAPRALLTDAPPGTLAGMNSCCVRITWTPRVLSSISDLTVVSYSRFSGFS